MSDPVQAGHNAVTALMAFYGPALARAIAERDALREANRMLAQQIAQHTRTVRSAATVGHDPQDQAGAPGGERGRQGAWLLPALAQARRLQKRPPASGSLQGDGQGEAPQEVGGELNASTAMATLREAWGP